MIRLDIFSSFMKINIHYRKIYKMKGSVITNKVLSKTFEINSEYECKLYLTQLKTHFKFVWFPY